MSSDASAPYPRPRGLNSHPSQPVSFTNGLLAGRTLRIEIEEAQKADLGRKFARKDKRPLDPPPVVICSFFNLASFGAPSFCEQALDIEAATLGAICYVDIFPVPPNYEDYIAMKPPTLSFKPLHAVSLHRLSDRVPSSTHGASSNLPPVSTILRGPLPLMPYSRDMGETSLPLFGPFHPATAGRYAQTQSSLYSGPMIPMAAVHTLHTALPSVQPLAGIGRLPDDGHVREIHSLERTPEDIVAWFGSHPIRESDKCSSMLAGATFVQAEIVDYNGKKEAMFVFSDLAVKVEGTFVLRYRTMNLLSQLSSSPPFRVLAECFGGPFKVYSTKEFPGLLPSTPLTKLLSMYGIRVNMRENERKRRTKSEIDAGVKLDGMALVARRGGGSAPPTQTMHHSPTSTTSAGVESFAATGPHNWARLGGRSRGSANGMHGGMDVEEWDEDR